MAFIDYTKRDAGRGPRESTEFQKEKEKDKTESRDTKATSV